MAATKTARPTFSCVECGWTTSKWVGRCGECQAWGTVEDSAAGAQTGRTKPAQVTARAQPIGQVDVESSQAGTSGVGELDRVLGGGVVPGAVLLLAGEPGVGKSTLLLEVASRWAQKSQRTLYISGEESAAQVRLRADRTGAVQDSLYLAAETDLGAVLSHIDDVKPSLLIIDSVQTISSADVDGVPGGVTQVREVAASIIQLAKRQNIATLLVGHVTKDGTVAGPRALEHLVDVVLQFEGDRNSRLRLLRAVKNRFGPVDEIGCFDLVDDGIIEVLDPTGLFISRHHRPVAGTCVTVTMEGRRPLLAEVQSLSDPTSTPQPRRTTSGLDSSRVAMILAVLSKHCGLKLSACDIYAATVGGARLVEPAVDLAIAIATASAHLGLILPQELIAIGEVGLAGEVRKVKGLSVRLREASRIGYQYAIVPSGSEIDSTAYAPLRVVEVPDVRSALDAITMLQAAS